MSDADQGQELVPEGQTEEQLPSSTKPEEEVEVQTQDVEPTLPDGVKERTAQEFEKLKEHNRDLAAKLAQYETPKQPERPSFFDIPTPAPAQYPGVSQQEINQRDQNLVDKDGYLDVERLKTELQQATEAKQIALQAADEAKRTRQEIERYNHTQEVTKTYAEYPELDPDNKEFDSRFYDMVTNEIYGQTMKGKRQDFLTAAKEVSKLYNPRTVKATKLQQVEDTKTKRIQATTTVGKGQGTPPPVDHEELVTQSIKGNMDAIYARLKASGN